MKRYIVHRHCRETRELTVVANSLNEAILIAMNDQKSPTILLKLSNTCEVVSEEDDGEKELE